jgi:hypothetical protein
MNKPIYVMVDTSGSMNEMGKSHLLRNLCRFISELPIVNERNYSNVEFRFFEWNKNVSELVVENNGDFPEIRPQLSSDLQSLSEFFINGLNENEEFRALIFADGNFPTSDVDAFSKIIGSSDNLITRVVAIGADANVRKLQKMSSNNSVYLPENISTAINSICVGRDEKIVAPESVSQIRMEEPSEPVEDWDE